jgi:hypothetical protein
MLYGRTSHANRKTTRPSFPFARGFLGEPSWPLRCISAFGPTLPAGWSVVCMADFNGDGKPDYLHHNSSTRQTAICYLSNNVRIGSAYGPTLPPGWNVVAP